jgi:enoyl-CoA hydratase
MNRQLIGTDHPAASQSDTFLYTKTFFSPMMNKNRERRQRAARRVKIMLVCAEKKPGILVLTVLRPEKRNALNHAVITEIQSALEHHGQDLDLKLLLVRGSGDRAFASGGDLNELDAIRTEEGAVAMSRTFRNALDSIRNFPVPSIAVLNGSAFGGGAELAFACDLRVAAPHAKIGFLQAKLNISTAWGGGVDLLTRVGPSRALRLLGTAEILSAKEAHNLGVVDAVAPGDTSLEDFVEDYCRPFCGRAPQVMRAIKALLRAHALGGDTKSLLDLETRLFAENWVHEDHWRAVEQSLGGAGRTSEKND